MGIWYNEDTCTYTIQNVGDEFEATFTKSGEVAADWVDDILLIHQRRLSYLIVGLDLEWNANRAEKSIFLLKLCVGRRCLIFQLRYCDFIPDKLRDFLKDDRFRFVGVGIRDDAMKLEAGYGMKVGPMTDLRDLASEKIEWRERWQWQLKIIARKIMGVEIVKPKKVTQSYWGNRLLSHKQIEYAAVDAFVSFEVGRRLYAGEF